MSHFKWRHFLVTFLNYNWFGYGTRHDRSIYLGLHIEVKSKIIFAESTFLLNLFYGLIVFCFLKFTRDLFSNFEVIRYTFWDLIHLLREMWQFFFKHGKSWITLNKLIWRDFEVFTWLFWCLILSWKLTYKTLKSWFCNLIKMVWSNFWNKNLPKRVLWISDTLSALKFRW